MKIFCKLPSWQWIALHKEPKVTVTTEKPKMLPII